MAFLHSLETTTLPTPLFLCLCHAFNLAGLSSLDASTGQSTLSAPSRCQTPSKPSKKAGFAHLPGSLLSQTSSLGPGGDCSVVTLVQWPSTGTEILLETLLTRRIIGIKVAVAVNATKHLPTFRAAPSEGYLAPVSAMLRWTPLSHASSTLQSSNPLRKDSMNQKRFKGV